MATGWRKASSARMRRCDYMYGVSAKRDLQEQRRIYVARLRAKYRMTIREIADALGKPPYNVVNPDTGKPFSRNIIDRDLQHLRKQWQQESRTDTAEHIGRLLFELDELRRCGWIGDGNTPNFDLIKSAHDREVKLRGLVAEKVELSGRNGGAIQHQEVKALTDEQLAALALGLTDKPAEQATDGTHDADGQPTD